MASDDPFDTARSAFVKADDCLGRLVLVYPKEEIEAISNLPGPNQGKPYPKIVGDTYVLDGETNELITELPFLVPGMHWSGASLVPQLRTALSRRRPVLGRVRQVPARTKGFGPAWQLDGDSLTADDKKLGKAAHEQYEAENDPFN